MQRPVLSINGNWAPSFSKLSENRPVARWIVKLYSVFWPAEFLYLYLETLN
jgi:hypothetical protein